MSLTALASHTLGAISQTSSIERRVVRSHFRDVALELMLAAFRHRNSLDAALVADDHGLLLAGCAMPGINLDSIAALLPIAPGKDRMQYVASLSFKLEVAKLHVGVIGATAAPNSLLNEIAHGAKRILTY